MVKASNGTSMSPVRSRRLEIVHQVMQVHLVSFADVGIPVRNAEARRWQGPEGKPRQLSRDEVALTASAPRHDLGFPDFLYRRNGWMR